MVRFIEINEWKQKKNRLIRNSQYTEKTWVILKGEKKYKILLERKYRTPKSPS